jgi:hypothetical protein
MAYDEDDQNDDADADAAAADDDDGRRSYKVLAPLPVIARTVLIRSTQLHPQCELHQTAAEFVDAAMAELLSVDATALSA